MKNLLTMGLVLFGWGCVPGDACSNDCECRAAVNRCIESAAARLRARAESDGAHFRDRAAVIEAQKRPYSAPEEPTIEQLESCEIERAAHIEALRDFPELSGCM